MTGTPVARKQTAARYEWLERCRDSDFDGHGNFASLTPSQRLEWLVRAGDLVRSLSGRARSTTSGQMTRGTGP